MKIFCTGNIRKNNFYDILNEVILINENFKHILFFDNKLKNENFSSSSYKTSEIKEYDFDLIICIGGDGSLLSAVRNMGNSQKPILGIHIGNLGFLNQANKNNFKEILNNVFSLKKIDFIEYSLIETDVIKGKDRSKDLRLLSLNDLVIKHADLLKLIELEINLDNEFYNTYACDGIIFSTPLGSTAYSLSAGGPIVLHGINSLIITPISAHSLSSRPMIIDDKKNIIVTFPNYEFNINVVSDGQDQHLIDPKSIIKIKKSKIKAKFVYSHLMETYFSKLKDKIGFSGSNNKK